MTGWQATTLGEIADLRKGLSYKGEFLDKPGSLLLGLGVVRPGGGYLPGKGRAYGGPFKERHVVEPGDLVLALTDLTQEGRVLGSPFLVPPGADETLITHHVAAVRLRPGVPVHPEYLYYWLTSEASRASFRGLANGTTVRAVAPRDAAFVEVQLPSMPQQRAIAGFLGAIDAKIRAMRRMSQTLEDIAHAVFRARIVDFDSQVESAGTPPGALPPGWRTGTTEDLIEFNPRVPLRKGEESVYVDMKALPTEGPSVRDVARRGYKSGARFLNGDTLFARITPCLENGKSGLVDFLAPQEVAAGSTEFIVMRPREGVPRGLPYCVARLPVFRAHAIANMTGTSGRQRVPAESLRTWSMAIPPPPVLQELGEVIDPLFAGISANMQERRVLTELRETLLPRLLSGELQLPDAATTAPA